MNEAEKMAESLERWHGMHEAAALIRRLAAENADLKAELAREQKDRSEQAKDMRGLMRANEALSEHNGTQAERIKRLEEALRPFAGIKPSSLHLENGSDAEPYVVTLKAYYGNPAEFTGADLARARAALEPRDE